jgi:hypothetical protein
MLQGETQNNWGRVSNKIIYISTEFLSFFSDSPFSILVFLVDVMNTEVVTTSS